MFVDNLNLGAGIFYSDVKDKIFTKQTNIKMNGGTGYKRQMKNVGKVQFYGVELSSTWLLNDDFELGANYTYLDTKDGKDGDGKTVYMTDIPHHKFFAYLDWGFAPKFSIFVSQEAQSKSLSSYDDKSGKNSTQKPLV